MKKNNRHPIYLPSILCALLAIVASTAEAQITPVGDSYTNSAAPTTNYGAKTTLNVNGATQASYIQFDLTSIPSTASVSKATLKLFVNAVTTGGTFDVDYVNGTWQESTIYFNNQPAPGGFIGSATLTTTSKNQYIPIDVTSAVQAWLNGSEQNNGVTLVAVGNFNANFDSKESTTTSHSPELDVAFGSGSGTITGVTTGPASGLTGGGTSGTVNLSLLTNCGANQVLQWNGSAWACASAGSGTVSNVSTGTGLIGGPITNSGTISVNTSTVPLLASSNNFTGNQTVSGNLYATTLGASSISSYGNSGSSFTAISATPAIGVTNYYSSGDGVDVNIYGTGKIFGISGVSSASSEGAGVYGVDGSQS